MVKKVSNQKSRYKNKTITFPGDRTPAKSVSKDKMFYEKKLSKYKGKMRWLVIERPTGNIIMASPFEDEAEKIANFQNKHKLWVPQGGLPKFLVIGKI
jgi:hypothetical protein|tara:strand:+ start:430 stop:723 length:294 start_codon:yes stop_codon:yes gene_type:complete